MDKEDDITTIEDDEQDLTGDIMNLAGAYSSLAEVDIMMMEESDQAKLRKARSKLLKTILEYCARLP